MTYGGADATPHHDSRLDDHMATARLLEERARRLGLHVTVDSSDAAPIWTIKGAAVFSGTAAQAATYMDFLERERSAGR